MFDLLGIYLAFIGTIALFCTVAAVALTARYIWRELIILALVVIYIAWRLN